MNQKKLLHQIPENSNGQTKVREGDASVKGASNKNNVEEISKRNSQSLPGTYFIDVLRGI